MARKKDDAFDVTAGMDFSVSEEVQEEAPSRTPEKINPIPVEKQKRVGRPKGSTSKDPKDKVQHFSTSLPPDIIKALNEQALKEDRPVSKVVARAIKSYIDNN